MSDETPPAPSAIELLARHEVVQALQQAWSDSLPADPARRHEEGGWLYLNPESDEVLVRRAKAGNRFALDVSSPPLLPDYFLVATFHTHPNPTAEGWNPQPSEADTESAWELGVPCLIQSDTGVYWTGPERRRNGLGGNPSFPD
jgi:hypothetical protein